MYRRRQRSNNTFASSSLSKNSPSRSSSTRLQLIPDVAALPRSTRLYVHRLDLHPIHQVTHRLRGALRAVVRAGFNRARPATLSATPGVPARRRSHACDLTLNRVRPESHEIEHCSPRRSADIPACDPRSVSASGSCGRSASGHARSHGDTGDHSALVSA